MSGFEKKEPKKFQLNLSGYKDSQKSASEVFSSAPDLLSTCSQNRPIPLLENTQGGQERSAPLYELIPEQESQLVFPDTKPSLRIEQQPSRRTISFLNSSQNTVFYFDRKGDRQILVYGSLYKGGIPVYRQLDGVCIIGLSEAYVLQTSKSPLTHSVGVSIVLCKTLSVKPSLFKQNLADKIPKIPLYLHSNSEIPRDKRARAPFSEQNFVSLTQEEPEYSDPEPKSGAQGSEAATLTHVSPETLRKQTHFNVLLQTQQKNPKLWLDFIKFQTELFGIGEINQENVFSLDTRAARKQVQLLNDKKLAIFEKALKECPKALELDLEYLKLAVQLFENEKLLALWDVLLSKFPTSLKAWVSFLDFKTSVFSLFKFSSSLLHYQEVFSVLDHQPEDFLQREEWQGYRGTLLFKLVYFLNQCGFSERAFGIILSNLELNVLCLSNREKDRDAFLKSYLLDYWMNCSSPHLGTNVDDDNKDQGFDLDSFLQQNKGFGTPENVFHLWFYAENQQQKSHWKFLSLTTSRDSECDFDKIVSSDDIGPFLHYISSKTLLMEYVFYLFKTLQIPIIDHFITHPESSEPESLSESLWENSKVFSPIELINLSLVTTSEEKRCFWPWNYLKDNSESVDKLWIIDADSDAQLYQNMIKNLYLKLDFPFLCSRAYSCQTQVPRSNNSDKPSLAQILSLSSVGKWSLFKCSALGFFAGLKDETQYSTLQNKLRFLIRLLCNLIELDVVFDYYQRLEFQWILSECYGYLSLSSAQKYLKTCLKTNRSCLKLWDAYIRYETHWKDIHSLYLTVYSSYNGLKLEDSDAFLSDSSLQLSSSDYDNALYLVSFVRSWLTLLLHRFESNEACNWENLFCLFKLILVSYFKPKFIENIQSFNQNSHPHWHKSVDQLSCSESVILETCDHYRAQILKCLEDFGNRASFYKDQEHNHIQHVVSLTFCYGMLLYLGSRSLDFCKALDEGFAVINSQAQAFPQIHERISLVKIEVIELYAANHAFSPRWYRAALTFSLALYPENEELWKKWMRLEIKSQSKDRLWSFFFELESQELVSPKLYLILIHYGILGGSSCHRLTHLFELALKKYPQFHSFWELYIRWLVYNLVPLERLKELLYRAIKSCPWNKNLYLLAVELFKEHPNYSKETTEFINIMIEKELRAYTLVEEIQAYFEQ